MKAGERVEIDGRSGRVVKVEPFILVRFDRGEPQYAILRSDSKSEEGKKAVLLETVDGTVEPSSPSGIAERP